MDWKPISDCPENTDVLGYFPWMDDLSRYEATRFRWVKEVVEELVDEHTNKSGRRRIYQERTVSKKEWDGCGGVEPDAWCPLTPPDFLETDK